MTIRNSSTYDNLLLLKDAGAITASGAGTVAGGARVIDLGPARTEAKAVVDVSAVDATGDRTYRVTVQGSNAIGFGSGVVELGSVTVGAAARAEVHFVNQIGATLYQFVRVFSTVAGTTPSINFTALIAKT